ncbi:MAG: DUF1344 domain-containing protein [Hoeflea sp.]|nr:DUF1344 domain-containing protein [Alphaproteobacteria bacterium]MBV1725480.1 DUF1344 domain-containing protein [Hoeflea sp.]MBU4547013.1 DUF1344 domain-containing protein [Alphaproteobacteria bacterium]MBU4551475.1 DUF1344 domain-containing protein [Alphaproteobacteria bacterium]MBV1759528.1 DUF1344 domain-containing protein [Hoeflea sp.]
MKSILAAASVLALTGAALAAEVEGVVTNYDAATNMIMLESGETFTLAEGVVLDGLTPGGRVVITYDDGTTNATSVTVVE